MSVTNSSPGHRKLSGRMLEASAQRIGVQLPRALHKLFIKTPISCAKRSTATPCWASTIGCQPRCNCFNHTTFHLAPRLTYGCATRPAQRRRVPAAVFVPASLRRSSATGVRLHRSRSGPRGASHSHFLMRRCACRAAWCATGIVWRSVCVCQTCVS